MPGYPDRTLSDDDISTLTREALAQHDLAGKRVLVLVPDGTRTAPIPLMFRLFCQELRGRAAALDFLIALGTHRPMSQGQIDKLFGVSGDEWKSYSDTRIYNHHWEDPATFVTLGRISEDEIFEMSGGMIRKAVEVRINRLVNEYDQIIICGPVFPHEVVGFSGGNKYFFPGISGPEIIDLSHWLGALITSYATIGTKGITPMRAIINQAASLIATPRICFAMVVAVNSARLHGLYIGTPEAAWADAVELSAQVHIQYVDRPFQRVLSVMPEQYDDIWTAAKGMYKLEPVIADGGEVIIYAPHITEFSYTHGKVLAEVGYHVRDYFVKQWDRFANYPTGVLAHSTHLRGIGEYDNKTGEKPRIRVTLATGISAERCAAHNLGYLDARLINPEDYANREGEGILLVRKAGEMLYRLRTSQAELASAGSD
jgi:nickel-dependent lactate racemase